MQVMDSLNYPVKDANWPAKVGIGTLFSLLSVALIGSIVNAGYSIKVMRSAVEGEQKLPEWDNWSELLFQGLILMLVSLVVFLIPTSMILFAFGSVLWGIVAGGAHESAGHFAAGAGIGLVVGGAGVLFMLVACFLFPMMGLRVAVHRSFGAAFDVGAVMRDIMRIFPEYLVMLLVLAGIYFAAGMVLGMLAFIPFLPQIALLGVSFYLMLVSSHTLGTLYRTRLAQSDIVPAGESL